MAQRENSRQKNKCLSRNSRSGPVSQFRVTWLTAHTHQVAYWLVMDPDKNEVICPLCYGHGVERKERMVVRWRSREFEQSLQTIADEAAFGTAGGLDSPFERHEPVYSNESD